MAWRTVCIRESAKLDLRNGELLVRGKETTRVHLSEVLVLLIESTACAMTTALIAELAHQKVKVIFCDPQHNPVAELIPTYGAHNTSLTIKNQTLWNSERKKMIWAAIVHQKISQQAILLERMKKPSADLLRSYLATIEPGDETNREGFAAKVYFNALFGMEFKRDEDSPINSALNYGYALLLSVFNREVVASGRITQLGIWHENQFNYFNLSSDLMEPFRPLVDMVVYNLSPKTFGKDEKEVILRIFERKVQMFDKQTYLPNAIGQYVLSICAILDNPDEPMDLPALSYE